MVADNRWFSSFIHRDFLKFFLLLLIALGLRLYHITEPLIDAQCWRQADTASIARNFFKEEMNIFHPRIDWRGASDGLVESEFPLYPFLVACVYHWSGHENVIYGRLLSVAFALLAIIILYIFSNRLFDRETAYWTAGLFALLPISWYYTRTFMPESMMMFFYLLALQQFHAWVEHKRRMNGWLAGLAISLAILVKLTAIIVYVPLLAMLVFPTRIARQRWLQAGLILGSSMILPVVWYGYAYFYLFQESGLTFGILSGYGYNKFQCWSLWWDENFWSVLYHRWFGVLFTPVGGSVLLLSLGLSRIRKSIADHASWLYAWFISVIVFILIVAEGNRLLEYYQFFIIPVAAIFIVRGLFWLRDAGLNPAPLWLKKVFLPSVFMILLAGSWMLQEGFYTPTDYIYQSWQFAREVQGLTKPEEKFVVVDSPANYRVEWYLKMEKRISPPCMLYYLDRKGWVILPHELLGYSTQDYAAMHSNGANYLVIPRYVLQETDVVRNNLEALQFSIVRENQNFILYRLQAKP